MRQVIPVVVIKYTDQLLYHLGNKNRKSIAKMATNIVINARGISNDFSVFLSTFLSIRQL